MSHRMGADIPGVKKRVPDSAFRFVLDRRHNSTNFAFKGQVTAFALSGVDAVISCFVKSANLTASTYFRDAAVRSSFINEAILTAHAYFGRLTVIFT